MRKHGEVSRMKRKSIKETVEYYVKKSQDQARLKRREQDRAAWAKQPKRQEPEWFKRAVAAGYIGDRSAKAERVPAWVTDHSARCCCEGDEAGVTCAWCRPDCDVCFPKAVSR